jgi:NAD-dependent SIR2 family protein deacetylase
MSSRIAKLAESSNLNMRDDIYITESHGTLPSRCTQNECNGFLDFVRVHDTIKSKTVLKCRECGHELELD